MADITPDKEKRMTFTALVRIHEANCGIDYPSDLEQNFRIAIMKAIADQLRLRELRHMTLAGPGKGVRRPKEET
jgi:hypothetical protein